MIPTGSYFGMPKHRREGPVDLPSLATCTGPHTWEDLRLAGCPKHTPSTYCLDGDHRAHPVAEMMPDQPPGLPGAAANTPSVQHRPERGAVSPDRNTPDAGADRELRYHRDSSWGR